MILVSIWPTVLGVFPDSPIRKNEYCVHIVACRFVAEVTAFARDKAMGVDCR